MKKIKRLTGLLGLTMIMLGGCLSSLSWGARNCDDWAGRVISVQGEIQSRKEGDPVWAQVELDDTYCPGDMIRVGPLSRAGVLLKNDTVLRLDENTTVTFAGEDHGGSFLLRLLSGAVHFFSRTPRGFKIITPFVNATIGGTEFLVRVDSGRTEVTVYEGLVTVENELGTLPLAKGESAVAAPGKAPARAIVLRPRDAVQWAIYSPAVLDERLDDYDQAVPWQAKVRSSLIAYLENDLTGAFGVLQGEGDPRDPRFFTHRAALFLTVGRIEEARKDIDQALVLDPADSRALALLSIIELVKNDKVKALQLAKQSVALDAGSSTARMALSYARQAHFDLKGALESAKKGASLSPESALVRARLAELLLSLGYLDQALREAGRAVTLNPRLGRTQTVLGFARLTQIRTNQAIEAFETAIRLDQADPLPRVGLGLAKIREGNLAEGRREIEIAVILDPNNSLVRSYLGKAYFEEKRGKRAGAQFNFAKELDPQDPTPYYYDAISKEAENRPVEALNDLQKSIELNDNRAVFRSRLQLDQDLAARSVGLSGIYSDLGFQQLALTEGYKSLNADPGNSSAHRLLAETYSSLPRHEVARVSEVLQSQLLQPLNSNPVPPRMAEPRLLAPGDNSFGNPTFYELNSLFDRNRFRLLAGAVAGEKDTYGNEVVQSGLWDNFSYSLGQYFFKSDGFRANNEVERELYNVFVQAGVSPKTSLQFELRVKELENGDLPLRFYPDFFLPTKDEREQTQTSRFGLRHSFTPQSTLLASFIYEATDFTSKFGSRDFPSDAFVHEVSVGEDDASYIGEIQHLYRSERFSLITGAGHFRGDVIDETNFGFLPPLDFLSFSLSDKTHLRHENVYVYSLIHCPRNVTWILGGSGDFIKGGPLQLDEEEFSPKLGLVWNPFPGTTLRAAGFKNFRRSLVGNQTLEPTQIAGFNQQFDDAPGTSSWRYGVGLDQKITPCLFGGVELSKRDLDVPLIESIGSESSVYRVDWEERLARVYLNWVVHKWLTATIEYQYERLERDDRSVGIESFTKATTHRVPVSLNFFHPVGIMARLRATYIHQEGDFSNPFGQQLTAFTVPGKDNFWVLDAALGYRLPNRWGIITVEAKNLLDERFHFQDTDPSNPSIFPERAVLTRITLSF